MQKHTPVYDKKSVLKGTLINHDLFEQNDHLFADGIIIFVKEKFCIFYSNFTAICFCGFSWEYGGLVQVMTWHRIGDKPLYAPMITHFTDTYMRHRVSVCPDSVRADSRFVPSQWETALLCNDASHWLGASLESALSDMIKQQNQWWFSRNDSISYEVLRFGIVPWGVFSMNMFSCMMFYGIFIRMFT